MLAFFLTFYDSNRFLSNFSLASITVWIRGFSFQNLKFQKFDTVHLFDRTGVCFLFFFFNKKCHIPLMRHHNVEKKTGLCFLAVGIFVNWRRKKIATVAPVVQRGWRHKKMIFG